MILFWAGLDYWSINLVSRVYYYYLVCILCLDIPCPLTYIWRSDIDRCYSFRSDVDKIKDEAEYLCQQDGAALASLDTKFENSVIIAALITLGNLIFIMFKPFSKYYSRFDNHKNQVY